MRHVYSIFVILGLMLATVVNGHAFAQEKKEDEMTGTATSYQAKDYSRLLGTPGLSDTLLNNHFKLYQGYVKSTNAVLEALAALSAQGKDRTPEYAELKRRLGWEFDGMRLHELYFGNLGGKAPLDTKGTLAQKLAADFGGFENWKKDFLSTGAMRGIGWVVLYQDPAGGRLINTWINEHDIGHLAGCQPLLVMDVFEHAYLTDYQLDRAKYMEAFMASVDWKAVESRLVK